jgi:hypothetical protein
MKASGTLERNLDIFHTLSCGQAAVRKPKSGIER